MTSPPVPYSVHWALVDARADPCTAWLTEAERVRHDRMRSPAARRRFVTGRRLARTQLSVLVGLPPAEIVFANPCATCHLDHGRPAVLGSGIDFSLSHSGDLVGLAVVTTGPQGGRRVGFDVEGLARSDRAGDGARAADTTDIAELVLAPSERAAAGSAEPGAFIRTWTRKEAVVKALGTGLHTDLRTVVLTGPSQAPRVLAWAADGPAPALADVATRSGFAAAVCIVDQVPLLLPDAAPRPVPSPSLVLEQVVTLTAGTTAA